MKPVLKHALKNNPHQYGFTVIELMITITIIVLVTGLIMIQYASFNSSVLLKSQAYLTAFDIREAQSLSVSVRGTGVEFREEYGLYFDAGNRTQYILFQDNDANNSPSEVNPPVRYNATGSGGDEQIGVPYKVDPRFSIVNICVTNTSNARTCYVDDPNTTGEATGLASLAISFQRPDFDALFYTPTVSNIQSAEIQFGTPSGNRVRTVNVYRSGQVSVK